MSFGDPLTIATIIVGVIVACAIVIYAMRKRGKKEEKTSEKEELDTDIKGYPLKIVKSVRPEDASQAKEELRILGLEREILSDAIRRLYEAHAEGKINEEERERLAESFKSRMMTIKDAISRNESLSALYELETMQEDLMKLFVDRFGELSSKIEELRPRAETKPIKEIPIPQKELATEAPTSEEKIGTEEKTRRKRKPAAKASPKTEAERKIEEIRAEVEKVLDRLGQMEIES